MPAAAALIDAMALGPLRDRVALVTGGSGGIGRAVVRRLAAAGCHVAVAYSGNSRAANEAVDEAEDLGVRARALQTDLSDAATVIRLAQQATEALGDIEVLVPNAGISVRTDLVGVDLDLWQRALAVNLTAPFLLAQHLVPGMAARGFGRVLFTSSVAAFTGGVVGPHYAASKAGRSQPVEAIALVKRALRSVRGRSSHVKGAYGVASDGAARHP